VDNQVDTTTGTVKVRASFANPNYKLFPNEFVNAKLLVKTLMGVNIVPTAAIQRNNEISFVYVVDDQNKVHSRDVQVATTNGISAAVTGVSGGERVVTDGFDKLQENTPVRIRPAAAKSPADATGGAGQQPPAREKVAATGTAAGGHKKHQKDAQ
jgi:multidrug efflux system membrane fusion protein